MLTDADVSSMAQPTNVVGLGMWNRQKLQDFDDLGLDEVLLTTILTMKCSGVPCTHSCEWKRRSTSSGSHDSSTWIFAVAMVALGSSSMI